MVVLPVLTVNRYLPSCEISTQHGAVWWSAYGEAPMELKVPLWATLKAETDPLPPPPWAFETYRWPGFAGETSLPKGPSAWAANGEPLARVSRPCFPTTKLSMTEVLRSIPTSMPMRLVPVELKRMSPGLASIGSVTVDASIG